MGKEGKGKRVACRYGLRFEIPPPLRLQHFIFGRARTQTDTQFNNLRFHVTGQQACNLLSYGILLKSVRREQVRGKLVRRVEHT